MPSAGQSFCPQRIGCFISPHGFGHAARSAGVIEAIHQYKQNLVLLPHHSDFYHPDLVKASDAVVGKVGYSTLAEVYAAGVPFGHISRAGFRESVQLVAYVQKEMAGLPIDEHNFYNGSWLNRLPQLLELPRMQRSGLNGSAQIAKYIGKLLDNRDEKSIKLCKTAE